MSSDHSSHGHEKKAGSPDPKTIFLLGLAVVAILYLIGGAINEFLTQFGLGLSNFAVRTANGANAMDAVFHFLFRLSLALSSVAIVVLAFKAASLYGKASKASNAAPPATPAGGAAPHP